MENFMKRFRTPRHSLRANLALGVTAMLLPWVMFVLLQGQLLFPRVIGAFENVVHKTGAEMHAVMNLQSLLLKAAMPPNDYLIHGDPAELDNFSRLGREADQAFETALGNYTGLPEQQGLIRMAREEWKDASRIAEALLALPRPVGDAAAAESMKRMDAHVYRAEEILDRIHGLARRQSTEQLDQARAVVQEAVLFVAAIFSVAIAMAAVSGFGLARAILVPLRALEEGANRLGAGDLSHRVTVDGQDELEQLAGTFNAMAERLEKSQAALEALSTHDGLTGLYNHREFQRQMDGAIAHFRRYGRPFALLMLDLDHFKVVNDTHGHQAGDEVLRAVADRIRAEVRPTDQVARYGGEEFAVILSETPGPGALAVAERIRAAIAARPIAFGEGAVPITITISIGVAAFPEDAGSGTQIVAAADQALYAAKNAGRNRAIRHEPAVSPVHAD